MRRLPFLLLLLCLLVPLSAGAQEVPIGPETYPDNVNPLTGLPVADPAVLDRRPLIVKIDNLVETRPQSGISRADLVWEHLLSGGFTRLAAVFLSNDVDHVGPIRSSRLLDFQLVRIYDAMFAYSGMARGTLDKFNNDPLARSRAIGGSGPCPPFCRFPEPGVAYEHTLFGSTDDLREFAETLERDTAPEPLSGMAFADDAPTGGVPVVALEVGYRQTTVRWEYDSATGRWMRSQDGEPHMDELTGEQLSAANVVIIEADHIEQPTVSENYWGPGNFAFEVDLVGSGRATLFRDGAYFEGEWRRESDDAPLLYYGADGEVMPFKPGNTFVNLVPAWVSGYSLTYYLVQPQVATVTGTQSVYLRVGPGQNFGSPFVGRPGESFPVIGRNNAGDWLQLLYDDRVLWAFAGLLEVDGDVMTLPITRPSVEG